MENYDVAIFKIAEQLREENLVCGEKCIKDDSDSGNIFMDTESKKNNWADGSRKQWFLHPAYNSPEQCHNQEW